MEDIRYEPITEPDPRDQLILAIEHLTQEEACRLLQYLYATEKLIPTLER